MEIIKTIKTCQGKCPKCGSSNLELEALDGSINEAFEGERIFADMKCKDCGISFTENYKLHYEATTFEEE